MDQLDQEHMFTRKNYITDLKNIFENKFQGNPEKDFLEFVGGRGGGSLVTRVFEETIDRCVEEAAR